MIKAVIFDMDGVLALTGILQAKAESKVLAKIGIKITPQVIVETYSGFKDTDFFKDVLRRYNARADVQRLRDDKWNIVYGELLPQGIPIIPGAKEFIKSLKSKYVLAIASSAPLKFIETVIAELGLNEFSVITSGDEVEVGKPDPTIFSLTAQKLNVPPQDCLVIEDAPSGVKAAKAAGMKCIAITTTHPKSELVEADKIIDSFNEINIEELRGL